MLCGSRSTGADQVDRTSTRLEQFCIGAETLKVHVIGSADALAEVVATAATDRKPAFEEYSRQFDLVSGSTKKARASFDQAQSYGTALFAEWTKRLDTMTDPDIREASEERRDALEEALASVADEAGPVLTAAEAYVATSKDLLTYLPQHLTTAGIEKIAGKAKSLGKSAKSIAGGLEDVVEVAMEVAPRFATAKPPPPPPK